MRFLFGFLSLWYTCNAVVASGEDLFPSNIFPISSIGRIEAFYDHYEDVKTMDVSNSSLSELRRRFVNDIKAAAPLVLPPSFSMQSFIEKVKFFKSATSSRQMSGVGFCNLDMKGSNVNILVLEPYYSDHARHVSSIVRQIASCSNIDQDIVEKRIPSFDMDKYKVINASFSTGRGNLSLSRALNSKALLIQASGNDASALTQLYASDISSGMEIDYVKYLHHHECLQGTLIENPELFAGMLLVGNLSSGMIPAPDSNRPGQEKAFQDIFVWAFGSDVFAKVSGKNIRMSGTSMAAPAVTGVVALIAEKYPHFTKEELQECIINSARQDFWMKHYEYKIFVHISPLIQEPFVDASRNDYLLAHDPYNPAIWGKGILDARRAFRYAELKASGKNAEEMAELLFNTEAEKEEKSAIEIQRLVRGYLSRKTSKKPIPLAEVPWWKKIVQLDLARIYFAMQSKYPSVTPISLASVNAMPADTRWNFAEKLTFTSNADLSLFELVLKQAQEIFPDVINFYAYRNIGNSEVINFQKSMRKVLDRAILEENWKIVHSLVDAGVDILGQNAKGMTVLHVAALKGNTEEFAYLLQAIKKSIVDCEQKKGSLLHFSVGQGNVKWVDSLLRDGANPHAKDSLGNTPLHLAAKLPTSALMVEILLGYGAHVQSKNNEGKTPHDLIIDPEFRPNIAQLLKCEVGGESFMSVETTEDVPFLRKAFLKYIIDAKGKGKENALFVAVESGVKEVVKLLLDDGASVSAQGIDGKSLIYFAAEQNRADIVELLIEYRADVHAYYAGNTLFDLVKNKANFSKIMSILEDAHNKQRKDRNVHIDALGKALESLRS